MKNKKINFCYFIICCITFTFSVISFNFLNLKKHSVMSEQASYYYTSNIEHLFTHCLIAYPKIAFDSSNNMHKHYLKDCITTDEFLKILNQLYKNNFVLVKLSDCFTIDNQNIAHKKKIKVPLGKKPLVLSFDDVNYDSTKLGKGMIDKIILDNNGNIATYTKFNTHEEIRYDNEFVCILENFIKKYPDFSINNARGTINLTGYDGILGYRTSHTNKNNLQEEILSAKKVVKKLKEIGWEFASHSYGHYHMKNISIEKFEKELNLWKTEVESIVGKTNIYVYPYGEWEVFDKNGDLSAKHKLLKEYGFNLFCGVGMSTFFSYLPSKQYKVLFMDRKCIDGYTISNKHQELYNFFNPEIIIDSSRFLHSNNKNN